MRSFATAFVVAALAAFTSAAPVDLSPPGTTASLSTAASPPAKTGGTVPPNTPSVPSIFNQLQTETQPYIAQLTYVDSSNASVPTITAIVASIVAPIDKAIPELEDLVGAEVSAILGVVDPVVDDVAELVGDEVKAVLTAVGRVLTIVKDDVPDILDDVEKVLADLGKTVTQLVGAVIGLVDGIVAPLAKDLEPVVSIIAELHLTDLAHDLDISL